MHVSAMLSDIEGPACRPVACRPLGADRNLVRVAVLETSGLAAADVTAMQAMLDAKRQAIAASIRLPAQRTDFIAAHSLLRSLLQQSFGVPGAMWTFGATDLGQPVVLSPAAMRGVRISLSHAKGVVAVAVARGAEIGVDVERTSADVERLHIGERFFAPAEAAHLRRLDDIAALHDFTALWTLKEAYTKAIGKGFAQPFRSFSFVLSEPPRIEFHDPALGDARRWRFWRTFERGFHLAAAYAFDDPARDVELELIRWQLH